MDAHILLWSVFGISIAAFLLVDLGWLNRKAQAVSTKSALLQSLFWVAISLIFATCVYFMLGAVPAAEYMSAYITEKMLSVDNLFVIILLFSFFKLEPKYHHRVLYWGILGAVVLRGIFIGLGAVVISQFHWILYIFGGILVYTGIKLLLGDEEDEKKDFEKSKIAKWLRKHLPFVDGDHKGKFYLNEVETGALVEKGGTKIREYKVVKGFTTLFLILLLVEATDIIFAIDSIPAAFSITQDPFLLFTANMYAVMGLRALFFLVENVLKKFHHLKKGVSLVLVFIGGKMLVDILGVHISPILSLFIILGLLIGSLVTSVVFPKKN